MKKTTLLKTLLMAVGLCVGTSAWADGTKRTLNAQNYETADVTDWTSNTATVSLGTGDATYGKYAKNDVNGTGNRAAYKSVSYSYTPDGYTSSAMTDEGYVIEFDLRMAGGRQKDRANAQFIVPTTGPNLGANATYSGSDYIFALSQPTNTTGALETTWYINDLTNASNSVTLADAWYHYTLIVTATSVDYTIIKAGDAEPTATGSKTVTSLPIIKGFYGLAGRTYGYFSFDNLDIYDYTASESVTSPTISSAYAGANRTVTITPGVSSESNTVTTYYTLDGSNPTNESTEYTTPLNITENCTVKAISISSTDVASPISSVEVTVGKLTLATPTITASGFTNTTGKSVNNPTFSFACNNSKIDGTPTATLYYTFTPYGGAESSETEGSSYTPTTYGTLKVIAKHDDYNSSEKTLVVSSLYTVSYTGRDYTTAKTTDILSAENWGDEFDVDVAWTGWASGLKANLKNPVLSDDYRLRINNTGTCYLVNGWGWVRPDKSYGYSSRYAKEGYFVGLKVNTSKGSDASELTYPTAYCSYGTGIAQDVVEISVDKEQLVQQLYFYEATPTSVPVTVTSAGYATYVPSYDLNFTGKDIKAYKVKVNTKGVATGDLVNNVPAGTPVLLKYDGGVEKTENIPVMTGAAAVTENDLVAGTGAAVPTSDGAGNTNMILNNVDSKIGFYFANGKTVATNRAYLHIDSDLAPDAVGGASPSRMVMVFADDETTGVQNLTPALSEGEGVVYNLRGQRVAQPTKGLYIVNGKKVVIK